MLRAWREATGIEIRDGYGQTETGQPTGTPVDAAARPGSMGRALPGMSLEIVEGELTLDPASVPTFFLGYLGEEVRRHGDGSWEVEDRRTGGPWRTGDRVLEDEDGWLYFEGRADDVIVSAGYRIGPFEVESALVAHPAVAEAAAVAAPDEERGAIVRAVVVLREGPYQPSAELVKELQEHVKRDGHVQVPPHHRLRGGAPEDRERQDQAGRAAIGRRLRRTAEPTARLLRSAPPAAATARSPPAAARPSASRASRSSERTISVTLPSPERRERPSARERSAAKRVPA